MEVLWVLRFRNPHLGVFKINEETVKSFSSKWNDKWKHMEKAGFI